MITKINLIKKKNVTNDIRIEKFNKEKSKSKTCINSSQRTNVKGKKYCHKV